MKIAIEHLFTGETTPVSSYDSTKTNLGTLIKQYNLGSNPEDKFAAPIRASVARPMEASTGIAVAYPCPIRMTDNLDYVFFAENLAAAVTRRIVMYTFDRNTSDWAWIGYITLTYQTATAHTIRGFEMTRDLYTTGTVSVSGTAVTGTGSDWSISKLSAGSRIGFGSTDPKNITTWYEISAIGSDTGITLTSTAGTIGAGASYIIEDWRAVMATSNATTTNGGVYVVKGLRPELFVSNGTAITAATTVDNIRGIYWLADAATVLNITAAGCALEAKTSWSSQYAYVLDTSGRVYKYNIRASLSGLAAGKSVSGFVFRTGVQAVTGTMSQTDNGVVVTAAHGTGNGIPSLYFVTTTRVYRAAISNITDASTTWLSDNMVEIPPGSASTFLPNSVLAFVEYSGYADRFIIMSTGAAGARNYVTRYNTISDPMDMMFLVDTKNLDHSLADTDSPPNPSINATPMTTWSEGGLLYICRNGATIALNQVYAIPIGAHWGLNIAESVITPEIVLGAATKLYRLYVSSVKWLGSGAFRLPVDAFRVYYRTSGINDNSGSWTMLNEGYDLSGVSPTSTIQFKFEFRVVGSYSLTARIIGLTVVCETGDYLPSQYAWNYSDMNTSDGTVGFIQKSLFSITIPVHEINYYRADTDALVLTQSSNSTTNGIFEYWNGSSWVAGTGTDTLELRRRFRPTAGLPSGVDVYAKIQTQGD